MDLKEKLGNNVFIVLVLAGLVAGTFVLSDIGSLNTTRTEDERQVMDVIDSVENGEMPERFVLSEESKAENDELARLLTSRLYGGTNILASYGPAEAYNENEYINAWIEENGEKVSADYELFIGGEKIDDVTVSFSKADWRDFRSEFDYSLDERSLDDRIRSAPKSTDAVFIKDSSGDVGGGGDNTGDDSGEDGDSGSDLGLLDRITVFVSSIFEGFF